MSKAKRTVAFFMVLALLLRMDPMIATASEIQYKVNVTIIVNGIEMGQIAAVDENYDNNMFISLKGLAGALQSTDKAFVPTVEKQKITITSVYRDPAEEPEEEVPAEEEPDEEAAEEELTEELSEDEEETPEETPAVQLPAPTGWNGENLASPSKGSIARNELSYNEEERRYYSIILTRDGAYDAFLPPICLAMLLDLDMKITGDRIEINTGLPYSVSAEEMEESGYLQGVNALVVGDGSAGEFYYEYTPDVAFPIASTTKLMTYFVFMEEVSKGHCSLNDTVVISEKAARLSASPDGVISMKAGAKVPVSELLYGMLLPSSNECALALAEHAAGSEEDFVELMNRTAQEMGWEYSEFYNCHGLPYFEDQLIPAKIHNHMTAREMFFLCSAIVDYYPQVTEITSTKQYHLDTFNVDVKNTNAVLYNMDNVVGFKTGTTNKAGACLITCASVRKNDGTHKLISVLFGAEGDSNRGIVSEMSTRYAVETLHHRTPGSSEEADDGDAEETKVIPKDPEAVIQRLLRGI